MAKFSYLLQLLLEIVGGISVFGFIVSLIAIVVFRQ